MKLGLKVGQSLLKAGHLRLNQHKPQLSLYFGHTHLGNRKFPLRHAYTGDA